MNHLIINHVMNHLLINHMINNFFLNKSLWWAFVTNILPSHMQIKWFFLNNFTFDWGRAILTQSFLIEVITYCFFFKFIIKVLFLPIYLKFFFNKYWMNRYNLISNFLLFTCFLVRLPVRLWKILQVREKSEAPSDLRVPPRTAVFL